jgi:phage terminase small subunit
MAAKGKDRPLTERQQKFVDEYLKTRDGQAAAIAVGYSEKTAAKRASLLMLHPAVAKRIGQESARAVAREQADESFVVRELMRIAEQDDVAQGTKVRALELLGKRLGLFEDRISLKTDGLTPEQRSERVAVLLERVRGRF